MIAIQHLFLRFLPENAKAHYGVAQSHLVPFLGWGGVGVGVPLISLDII